MRWWRPSTQRDPWPFHALLIDQAGQKIGLMLAPDPYHLKSDKQAEQEAVAPTEYGGSSRNPFKEGTRAWRHWIHGGGERIRFENNTNAYYIADGVDASCGGLAILGPELSAMTPDGAGGLSIEKIVYWPGAPSGVAMVPPTPRLLMLAGSRLLIADEGSGDPGDPATWRLWRDFADPLGTAPLPTVTSGLPAPGAPVVTHGAGSAPPYPWIYGYKLVVIGTTDPPHSMAGPETTIMSSGPLGPGGSGAEHVIDWTGLLPTGAAQVQVWRTTVSYPGAIVGKIYDDVVGAGTSYTDQDHTTVITGGAPPTSGVGGSSTWGYRLLPYKQTFVHRGSLGPEGFTNVGPAAVSASNPNSVTPASPAPDTFYEVWRTTAPAGVPLGRIGVGVSLDIGLPPDLPYPGGVPAAVTPQPTDVFSYAYGDRYFVLVGMSYGYYWVYDGTHWLQQNVPGTHFTNVFGLLYRAAPSTVAFVALAAEATNLYKSYTNPAVLSSRWDPVSVDADFSQPITNLFTYREAVLVFTKDKIYLAQGQDITPVVVQPSSDNGRGAFLFNEAVYAPFGGVWWKITVTSTTTATIEPTGIDRFGQNLSVIRGPVQAGVAHNDWFAYFAIWNGSDSFLGKLGSWVNPGETNSHLWEFRAQVHASIAKIPGRRVRSSFISQINGTNTSGNPRLYLGCDDGTCRLAVLPLATPFPPGDPLCRFQLDGLLQLSIDDFGFGANAKSYHRASVIGPWLRATESATLDYDLDGSGTYRRLPGLFANNGQSLNFTDDLLVADVTGHLIQLQLGLHSGSNTLTPQVSEVQLHAQVLGSTDEFGNPAFVRERTLTVRCGDGMVDREGHPILLLGGRELRQRLQALVAQAHGTLILPDGVKRTIALSDYHEGEILGFGAEQQDVVTLTFTETQLASGPNADPAHLDPGWGP